ncbi:MAG: hypothetical protein ACYTEX_12515 [Planctomycetota bacterium]
MARNDWEIGVLKMAVAIRRSGATLVFCQMKDYGLLAPLRSQSGMDFIALDSPAEALSVAEIDIPKEALLVNEEDYLAGLLAARMERKVLRIRNDSGGMDFLSVDQRKSDTLVVIERTGRC